MQMTRSGTRSLAYTSLEEGSSSDKGISLGDVTDPIVNSLRISLGLLTSTNLSQPAGAPDNAGKKDMQIIQLPRELVPNITVEINLLMIC